MSIKKSLRRTQTPELAADFTIKLEGVRARIGHQPVLIDITETIQPGEYVAIQGPSGSGKSTLAGLVMGLAGREGAKDNVAVRITDGTVCYDDIDIYALDKTVRTTLRSGRFGFAPPMPHLEPGKTALENIIIPMRLRGETPDVTTIKELADTLGMADHLRQPVTALSTGQQQRVNILRAAAGNPSVLVLDEPTSQLDTELKHTINTELKRFANEFGKTIVVVTHELSSAKRTIQLVGGKAMNHSGIVSIERST